MRSLLSFIPVAKVGILEIFGLENLNPQTILIIENFATKFGEWGNVLLTSFLDSKPPKLFAFTHLIPIHKMNPFLVHSVPPKGSFD